jgi:Ca2+-binding EF-hand superfamily protein
MNTSDPESGLNFKGLNKFCLDYSIQPTLVTTSFINSSFNRLTKDKNKFINFEDFLEFLAEVSFSAESLKEKDNDSVLFTSLMRHMKITLEKPLKKKS